MSEVRFAQALAGKLKVAYVDLDRTEIDFAEVKYQNHLQRSILLSQLIFREKINCCNG